MLPAVSAPRNGASLLSEGPLAGLDPGRSKCGLVLSDPQRQGIRVARVLPPEAAWQELIQWRQRGLVAVVLGDGTGSAAWRERLAPLLPVCLVEERGTTLAARERFWQLEPPRGWRRLLPAGLRQPPRDWDDVVAQLLLERYLGHPLERLETAGQPPLRTSPAR
jgi:RNase H-fold protein (predicted Holliday junction resolvase)